MSGAAGRKVRRLALLLALAAGAAPLLAQAPPERATAVPTEAPTPDPAEEPAEQLVAGLSQDAVSITTSFTGSEILIYGAIKRNAPAPAGPDLGVIVTVEGPSQSVTVRRKERVGGIWVNTDSLQIGAAPDFYVVATSGRLDLMLDRDEDVRFRISPSLAMRAFAGPVDIPDATDFTAALLRLRTESDRYRIDQGSVRIVDQTLFRADVRLPSNLIEGEYKTRIFLLRDGRVIDVHRAPIEVRKVGLERWLYHLALFRPFWYGLMSLAIAMAAGWAASAAFRAIQRK
ncbi:MAG TPA: TIGR02186 family protein [Paracoccus sp. (in: a-proteobacteria)]|nr:TIGR02186 family protein [Paracoccus sp. (in: a-proteobacteria)]